MPHFLIKNSEIKSNHIELCDENTLFHITKVRRVKIGEKIKFIDEAHNVYDCKITEINKKSLLAEILSKNISNRILKYDISLIEAILAPDSQNLLIANATQTGVKKIYPVVSDNVSYKASDDKIIKWQKIVSENFKQCERADMAKVEDIAPLIGTIKKFKKENVLIFSEKDVNISLNNSIKDIDKNSEIAIVIGPEGGFSEDEFEYFKKENYKLISLGNMIYKAPNAVVAGVSNIVSRLDDE
ncbi:MAG: RsmE family RNA methyltransferase [Candidatus Gastranaerophilales bacterium]|nr:RsmE family RNA methyltransferase [Candidatus Gastranaerophilales bacterium]